MKLSLIHDPVWSGLVWLFWLFWPESRMAYIYLANIYYMDVLWRYLLYCHRGIAVVALFLMHGMHKTGAMFEE